MRLEKKDSIVEAFHSVKKMSYRQFNDFLERFGDSCYWQGRDYAESVGTNWTEDEIFNLLRSEGIGAERANRIVDKLVKGVGLCTTEK